MAKEDKPVTTETPKDEGAEAVPPPAEEAAAVPEGTEEKPGADGTGAEAADEADEAEEDLVRAIKGHDIQMFNLADRMPYFSRFTKALFAPDAREVLRKFVFASACMFVLPITAFFMTMDYCSSIGIDDNTASTYAAVAAGGMVQVVAFGYVGVAIVEEMQMKRAEAEAKKTN
eukprot:TRINITY_DN1100_c0_g1_i1.p1 TRINITY_DN1100_c0_g1~~TRINITY_DN1100_c0_g1_i1.p1  ORF type:complete len:194 (+),score=90.89 TRINITY_DN1100_c0_g1_i1:64-582(+)